MFYGVIKKTLTIHEVFFYSVKRDKLLNGGVLLPDMLWKLVGPNNCLYSPSLSRQLPRVKNLAYIIWFALFSPQPFALRTVTNFRWIKILKDVSDIKIPRNNTQNC